MISPQILVLGGGGMLGHKLFQILRERFPGTVCTVRQAANGPLHRIPLFQDNDVIFGLDATNRAVLREVLLDLQPRHILNCVGIIKQREEAKAIEMLGINSLLPHQLAEMAAEWGGHVIHFSTDCVFSGKRGQYTEVDDSDAEDLYGKSKFLGEVAAPNALTLRTSIIGRELSQYLSLLEWLLAQNHKTIRGFRRVIYSGTTTNQMADVITHILTKNTQLNGLYQVVTTPITKHDLLSRLRDAYGLHIEIIPDDTIVSDRSLVGERFHAATGYFSPGWDVLVRQLVDDSTP